MPRKSRRMAEEYEKKKSEDIVAYIARTLYWEEMWRAAMEKSGFTVTMRDFAIAEFNVMYPRVTFFLNDKRKPIEAQIWTKTGAFTIVKPDSIVWPHLMEGFKDDQRHRGNAEVI